MKASLWKIEEEVLPVTKEEDRASEVIRGDKDIPCYCAVFYNRAKSHTV